MVVLDLKLENGKYLAMSDLNGIEFKQKNQISDTINFNQSEKSKQNSSVATTDITQNHESLAVQINLSKKNRPLNENYYNMQKSREDSIISQKDKRSQLVADHNDK